jgi:hypothetical protein
MEMIRDLVPYELEGNVYLAFASEGVRCRFDIPVSRLTNAIVALCASAALPRA